MAYRLSRRAEDDLIQIYVTEARDFGVPQAEAYFAGLEQAFAFLAEYPLSARERPEITPPVRIHPYRSHVIVYVIDGANIRVLRVRHGHEDWDG